MDLVTTEEVGPYDVVVVGGGVAGVCAALAAAREGALTVLIQGRPVLGGNSSSEIRVPPLGAGNHSPWANETGIILELLLEERLHSHDHVDYGMTNVHWDMTLYDAFRRQNNLELLLNTLVLQVEKSRPDHITAVIGAQSGTEKVMRVSGKMFLDCTGDGTVGVQASVPWTIGQEARDTYDESLAPEQAHKEWTLGSSLLFRARDVGRPVEFEPPTWAARYEDEISLRHRNHKKIEAGYWWIEVGAPFDTISQNEEIRDELLSHVLGVWDHIKNHCIHRDRACNYALDWVGMVPAKRESRRFIGAHVLTQVEIMRRELFPDRVSYGGWIIDDHTQGGILSRQKAPSFDAKGEQHKSLVAPYSVPLSSMYAPQVQNLFFGGRLLSASRVVFNSLRVQRTLGVCGQAAGTAAAYCAKRNKVVGDLTAEDIRAIQQSLLRQDSYIPFLSNEDPEDLARGAKVSASSTARLQPRLGDDWFPLAAPNYSEKQTFFHDVPELDIPPEGTPNLNQPGKLAQLIPVTAARVDLIRLYLRNRIDQEVPLELLICPALDIWDLASLERPPIKTVSIALPARFEGWFPIPVNMPVDAPGLLWFVLRGTPEVLWRGQRDTPPGLTSAKPQYGRWWFAPGPFSTWQALALDVLPESLPFQPELVVNGVTRAERWPNMWMSNPDNPLPQWLRLDLPQVALVGVIQVIFDTNLSRSYFQMPPFFKSPECVKDFTVEVLSDGVWMEVGHIIQNYQRRVIVSFEPREVAAVRITITKTNGLPEARIFEVRLYRDSESRSVA